MIARMHGVESVKIIHPLPFLINIFRITETSIWTF